MFDVLTAAPYSFAEVKHEVIHNNGKLGRFGKAVKLPIRYSLGLSRLELLTLRLSSVRSNQLSYKPFE